MSHGVEVGVPQAGDHHSRQDPLGSSGPAQPGGFPDGGDDSVLDQEGVAQTVAGAQHRLGCEQHLRHGTSRLGRGPKRVWRGQ